MINIGAAELLNASRLMLRTLVEFPCQSLYEPAEVVAWLQLVVLPLGDQELIAAFQEYLVGLAAQGVIT